MQAYRADLSDTTFIVPFRFDSPERFTNLQIVVSFLSQQLLTSIVVAEFDDSPKVPVGVFEQTTSSRIKHCFYPDDSGVFSRARCVNLAAQDITSRYLAINDADAIVQTWQYAAAAELLRTSRCQMAIPYLNRVMWVPIERVAELRRDLTDERLTSLTYEVSGDEHIFLGLVGVLETESFQQAGMMNEQFRAWGYEEMELYTRLLKLGFRVLRTDGWAYHLGHPKTANNTAQNRFFADNQREYHKVLSLNPDDLWHYVRSWPQTAGRTPVRLNSRPR